MYIHTVLEIISVFMGATQVSFVMNTIRVVDILCVCAHEEHATFPDSLKVLDSPLR